LNIPVTIHIADPVAFFDPLDETNDSYLELVAHPDWRFHGGDYPSFRELIDAGISLMARHPQTTFITAHVGWYSENLRFVGEEILDRLPNVYTDFSARLRWLGPQPYSARAFFLKYQDRILFGTDERPTPRMYRRYYRYLETADELFEARDGDFLSRSYGLYLPDDVLAKVYYQNAERVIPGLKS
jgi:predicted TIM-barrel fold metal-dependent hydrolase